MSASTSPSSCAEGQGALDLGLNTAGVDGEPLELLATKSSHLWEALCAAYRVLGFDAVGGDAVFRDLVLARIIEPTSKADSLRVLAETGIETVDYRTVTRHLPSFAKPVVGQALSAACAARAGLGPASLVLYDVSTLYFETDAGGNSCVARILQLRRGSGYAEVVVAVVVFVLLRGLGGGGPVRHNHRGVGLVFIVFRGS